MMIMMMIILMMIFFGTDDLMTSFPYSLSPPSLLFVSGCPSSSPNGVHSSGPTPQWSTMFFASERWCVWSNNMHVDEWRDQAFGRYCFMHFIWCVMCDVRRVMCDFSRVLSSIPYQILSSPSALKFRMCRYFTTLHVEGLLFCCWSLLLFPSFQLLPLMLLLLHHFCHICLVLQRMLQRSWNRGVFPRPSLPPKVPMRIRWRWTIRHQLAWQLHVFESAFGVGLLFDFT